MLAAPFARPSVHRARGAATCAPAASATPARSGTVPELRQQRNPTAAKPIARPTAAIAAPAARSSASQRSGARRQQRRAAGSSLRPDVRARAPTATAYNEPHQRLRGRHRRQQRRTRGGCAKVCDTSVGSPRHHQHLQQHAVKAYTRPAATCSTTATTAAKTAAKRTSRAIATTAARARPCAAPTQRRHRHPSCVGERVRNPTCDSGWGKCATPEQGCVTPLGTTSNCTKCGQACNSPTKFCDPGGCVDHRDIVVVASPAPTSISWLGRRRQRGVDPHRKSLSTTLLQTGKRQQPHGAWSGRDRVHRQLDQSRRRFARRLTLFNTPALPCFPPSNTEDAGKQSLTRAIYYLLDAAASRQPRHGQAGHRHVWPRDSPVGHGGFEVHRAEEAYHGRSGLIATGGSPGVATDNCGAASAPASERRHFRQTGSAGVRHGSSARRAPSGTHLRPEGLRYGA